MLRKMFCPLLFVCLLSGAVTAENDRTMVVAANPISALHGAFSGSFQYKIKDYLALNVPVTIGTNAQVLSWGPVFSALSGDNYDSSLMFYGIGLGARFLLNNNGFNDGFYLEPGVNFNFSKYNVKKDEKNLIDANRFTMFGTVGFGYSWFWESGFYLSPGIELGGGYHSNTKSVKIDENVKARLKDKLMLKYAMWAEDSAWRPHFAATLNLGYSW